MPGGNLGNVSAFGKAFIELTRAGPDQAAAAAGRHQRRRGRTRSTSSTSSTACAGTAASPTATSIDGYYRQPGRREASGPRTIASAIEINRPVNLPKALRALDRCGGVVREVTDQEILDAKAKVGAGGLGCEPASAASVAGRRKLRQEGVIAPSDRVVCILTGHQLKDPTATVAYHSADQKTFDEVLGQRGVRRATFANRAVQVPNDLDEIIKAIEVYA